MEFTADRLKEIMFKFNISNVELEHYTGYNCRYISGLRNDKYPITDSFKVALLNYLLQKKKMNINEAATIVGLGESHE